MIWLNVVIKNLVRLITNIIERKDGGKIKLADRKSRKQPSVAKLSSVESENQEHRNIAILTHVAKEEA